MGAMLWRHRPKGVLQQKAAPQPAVISWEAYQEALFAKSREYEAQLTALREAYEQQILELKTAPAAQKMPEITTDRQPKRK
jgi:hypothetical protein